MKKRSFGVVAVGMIFCMSMAGLTGCGKKPVEQPVATVSEDVPMTTSEANITKLKELLPEVDEASIKEAVTGIEALGFGQIQENVIVTVTDGNGKVEIVDENGMIISLVVKNNEITEALDADSKSAWLAIDLTAEATTFDVEEPTTETTPTPTEAATPTDADQTVSDNDVEQSSVTDQEFCTIEKQSDGSYKITSNNKLGDKTILAGGRRLSNYADVIDEALTSQKNTDAMNRDLFYDLIATSLMNTNTIIKEFKAPNYSVILAYISSKYYGCDNVTLEETVLVVEGKYCKFTYKIDNDGDSDIIVMDSDGIVTWDGATFDIKADKLQALKTALTNLEEDADEAAESEDDNEVAEEKPSDNPNYQSVYDIIMSNSVFEGVVQDNAVKIANVLCKYGAATQVIGSSIVLDDDVTKIYSFKIPSVPNEKPTGVNTEISEECYKLSIVDKSGHIIETIMLK